MPKGEWLPRRKLNYVDDPTYLQTLLNPLTATEICFASSLHCVPVSHFMNHTLHTSCVKQSRYGIQHEKCINPNRKYPQGPSSHWVPSSHLPSHIGVFSSNPWQSPGRHWGKGQVASEEARLQVPCCAKRGSFTCIAVSVTI